MTDNDIDRLLCEVCDEPFPDEYGKWDDKAPVYADDYVVHKGCEDELFEWSIEFDTDHQLRTDGGWDTDDTGRIVVTDLDTDEPLDHYEWNGWLWCENEQEAFDWETGDVECPHCGDTFHSPSPEDSNFSVGRGTDYGDKMEQVILECRGPDGWYEVERGNLPIESDHWGAQLRVKEDNTEQ